MTIVGIRYLHAEKCSTRSCGSFKVLRRMILFSFTVSFLFDYMVFFKNDSAPDSGHGGQSEDASGRESDGMDESEYTNSYFSIICLQRPTKPFLFLAIFPADHANAGDIIDDELYQALVAPLPPGCRLTVSYLSMQTSQSTHLRCPVVTRLCSM